MSPIRPLPTGPLDIVGNIHGEYDALCSLLRHLGYDQQATILKVALWSLSVTSSTEDRTARLC